MVAVGGAFAAGIMAQGLWPVYGFWILLVFLVTVILAVVFLSRPAGRMFFLLLAVGCLGALDMMHTERVAEDDLRRRGYQYYGRPVTVSGVISSDIQTRPLGRGQKTAFTLDVRQVSDDAASGKVLVVAFDPVDVRYGDELLVTGKLHRPFEYSSRGRLTYRSYLTQRGIHFMLTVRKGNVLFVRSREKGNFFVSAALHCRQHLNRILDRYLTPAEAGLMQALITGERKDVPPHVREIFFRTGTVHILAVSGMNVAMVAAGVFMVLRLLPIGRIWQMIFTMAFIPFYALMTGANAPVVRAAIMGVLFLTGFLIEREQDGVNSLFATAFMILVFCPRQIFDVGFQLSFGSVLSILVLSPFFLGPCGRRGLPKNRLLRGALEALIVSCVVMIGIGGLLAYYFQVVTPVALLANLPIIPLVALATALGAGVLAFGVFLPSVAVLFAACLKVTINLLVFILYAFSWIPGGAFFIPPLTTVQVYGYYLVLGMAYWAACVWIRSRASLWPAWQIGL